MSPKLSCLRQTVHCVGPEHPTLATSGKAIGFCQKQCVADAADDCHTHLCFPAQSALYFFEYNVWVLCRCPGDMIAKAIFARACSTNYIAVSQDLFVFLRNALDCLASISEGCENVEINFPVVLVQRLCSPRTFDT